MIIATTNKEHFEYEISNNSIKNFNNSFLISIEHIDNDFDDILIKHILKRKILYRNLKKQLHNPIGPALIFLEPSTLKEENYFLDGNWIPKENFYIK